MCLYMPRHYRSFLTHLENNPRPLRKLVISVSSGAADGQALLKTYNDAVLSLIEFRSTHMLIVALFIIGPAARHDGGLDAEDNINNSTSDQKMEFTGNGKFLLKGTGGTAVVHF